jgi:hypothetical protein
LEYLENLIQEERAKGHIMLVSVGTDSQREGRGYKFATVILINVREDLGGGVTKGLGGKCIERSFKMNVHKMNKEGVNERMMTEVSKSIEVAYEIAPLLDKWGIKLEIHADINPDPRWESHKALSSAIGYILGMGYDFKIKPEAWAASYAGDKYAH